MKNRTVIGIICIAAALAISFGIAPLTNRILDNKTEVVRVKKEVRAGNLITEDNVELVSIGAFNVPGGVLTNMLQALGQYATTDLYPGDYLFTEKLTYNGTTASDIIRRQDDGRMAVSVTLRSFAAGLSGKIGNGDIVRVMAFKDGKVIEPEELQYLMAVTTTTQSGLDSDELEAPTPPVTITLQVTKRQAEKLIYYENTGTLHFLLVHKSGDIIAQEMLEEQDMILGMIELREELEGYE